MLLKLYELTNRPWLLFVAVLPFLALCAYSSTGWLQADEHYRGIEPAFKLVHGYATLSWEIADQNPVVSWFLGVLLSPALMITKLLGIAGASTDAWAIRFLSGIVAALRFPALLYLLKKWSIRPTKLLGPSALLLTFGVFFPFLLIRSSQENFAATAMIWALYFFERARSEEGDHHSFLFGVFVSLAASFRLQLGPSMALLGLFFLISVPKQKWIQKASISAIGVLVGLVPLALVDFFTAGMPFLPAFNYLKYALTEEGTNTVWGTHPWYYYFTQYLAVFYPPLCLAFILAITKGMFIIRPLLIVILSFVLVHLILPHKETRYMVPILPLIMLSTILGLEQLQGRFWIKLVSFLEAPKTITWMLIFSALLSLAPLNPSHRLFTEMGRRIKTGTPPEELLYVADSRSGPPQFYLRQPDAKLEQWGLQFFDDVFNQFNGTDVSSDDTDLNTTQNQSFLLAAYRVPMPKLQEWQKNCKVQFETLRLGDQLLNWTLAAFGRPLSNRRTDALLLCPKAYLVYGKDVKINQFYDELELNDLFKQKRDAKRPRIFP